MRESRKGKKNIVLKTHNAHEYGFEVAWGTWGLVLLALCPFLHSLLVFLMQCNSVAQFRYILCQGHCISPRKEFVSFLLHQGLEYGLQFCLCLYTVLPSSLATGQKGNGEIILLSLQPCFGNQSNCTRWLIN